MPSSEEVIEIVRERVKGRVWTIYVCAEPDGQDCDSGTHPNILSHKCAAVRRFHETQGHASGPQLVEVDVTWIDGKRCRYEYRVRQRVYGTLLNFDFTSLQAAFCRWKEYDFPWSRNVVNIGMKRRAVGPWKNFKPEQGKKNAK